MNTAIQQQYRMCATNAPPPLRSYTFSGGPDAIEQAMEKVHALKEEELSAQLRIQAGKVKHDVSPRAHRVDVLEPLGLICLPDTSGVHRKVTRESTAGILRPVLGKVLGGRYVVAAEGEGDNSSGGAPEEDVIVVTGDVRPAYLLRIGQAAENRRVVYVGKDVAEIGNMAAAVMGALKGMGVDATTRNNGKYVFVRGYLPFLLSHVFSDESLSAVVISNPPLLPHPRQSHQRLVTRDLYMLAHRALRVRTGPNDPTGGFVTWTSNPEQFEFTLEQLEECRQVCPYAKKAPTVFEGLLPLEGAGEIKTSGSRFVCATKSAATPVSVKLLIEAHTFQRRTYKALFPTSD